MPSVDVWKGKEACVFLLVVGAIAVARLVAQLGRRNAQLVAEKERLEWDIATNVHAKRKSKSGSSLSLKSSSMESIDAAAAKCITRAPPPPKAAATLRIASACSEPSKARPKAALRPKPARALPAVERVGRDPREDC